MANQIIPLAGAVLCEDCQMITQATQSVCLACGSKAIYSLQAMLEKGYRMEAELSRTKEGWSELYNFMFFSKRLLDEEDAAQNCGDHCRNSCRWCGLRDTVTRADVIYPEATR